MEVSCHRAWNGRGTPQNCALRAHTVPGDNIDWVLTMQAFHGDSTQDDVLRIGLRVEHRGNIPVDSIDRRTRVG